MHAILFTLVLAAAPDAVAATVNGEAISLADVDRLAVLAPKAGPLTASQTRLLRESFLEPMIDDVLLRQYLDKSGSASDPKEIDQQYQTLKQSWQNKAGSGGFDAFLQTRGLSESSVRRQLDLQNRFRKLVESKTTPAQYQAYFEANRDVFDRATVTAAHILIPVSASAADGEWAAATQKLNELRKDIVAGHLTFTAAAKKFSLDPTAAAGGILGTLSRRDPRTEEPILKAAFDLKVNAISEPVRSIDGVHLVTVTAKSAGTATTFDKVAEWVKDEHAADARQNLLVLLRSKAEIKITLPK